MIFTKKRRFRILYHEPVMLNEVLELVAQFPHAKILDGTLGLGGYSQAMLEKFPGSEVQMNRL